MKIAHFKLEPGTVPVYGALMNKSVQISVPHKRWVRQKHKNKENQRVIVPLSLIQKREIHRWVREKAARLYTKSGTLILFYRPDADDYGNFGLVHDLRSSNMWGNNMIEGLPLSVDL